jgi:precorrin-3B synthase
MIAAPAIKGWCPTLLSPMQSGDGWLARVKPTAATLSANAARLIASGARRHGNGHIDLTSRANLQVRGLEPRSSELFAETIIGAGLGCADPSVEAIRNVMASPLGADDQSANFDAHALAREIEAMLCAEPALAALPDKFGVAVDAGGLLPLSGVSADIMLRAAGDAFSVRLDGGALGVHCPRSRLVETIRALALASLQLAFERREPPRRLRPLVRDVGEDAIFDAAGLPPIAMPSPLPTAAPSAVGFIPYPMGNRGAVGAGLPFGRIDAEQLAALAALSERFGDGSLRTTPWRSLLLPGVTAAAAGTLTDEVTALDLVADPSDPRLRIYACVGKPACMSASVDARGDATRLAAILAEDGSETLHVSGCAKSCAHRGPASLTLVGRDGRYDLIRNGGAADRPSLTGLGIDEIIALAGIAKEPVS